MCVGAPVILLTIMTTRNERKRPVNKGEEKLDLQQVVSFVEIFLNQIMAVVIFNFFNCFLFGAQFQKIITYC